MALRKKKSLLDQATDTVDASTPPGRSRQVDDRSTRVAASTRQAGPALADAKAKAGPALADAKAKAAPRGRRRGAALAAEKLAAGASVGRREGATEAAEAAAAKVASGGQQPKKKKGGKLKKLAALRRHRRRRRRSSPRSCRAATESRQLAVVLHPDARAPRARPTEDARRRRRPAEAISDAAETPHPVTTPDEPAEVVDVDDAVEDAAQEVASAGWSAGRFSSIQASICSHQPNSQSIRSSRSGRDLGARHLPPPHHDLLVHRQLAPDVADGEQVVEAGVRDQDDVGLGRRVERGEEAAGPRREHVGHLLGALPPSAPGRACAAGRSPGRGAAR